MTKIEIDQDEFERILNDTYVVREGFISSTLYPILKVSEDDDTETIILQDKYIAIREQAFFYKLED